MDTRVIYLIISENFKFQKNLDFTLKVIGGDISTIPGLHDAIEVWTTTTISTAFHDCFAIPLCLINIDVETCNFKLLLLPSGHCIWVASLSLKML